MNKKNNNKKNNYFFNKNNRFDWNGIDNNWYYNQYWNPYWLNYNNWNNYNKNQFKKKEIKKEIKQDIKKENTEQPRNTLGYTILIPKNKDNTVDNIFKSLLSNNLVSDTSIKEKKENISSFDDIFKVILGLDSTNNKINDSTSKLKLKEFDLSKEYEELDVNVETINDLIKLSELYDENNLEKMSKYSIDLKKLVNMKEPLIELNNMIGMDTVKKSIIRQILYFLQGIEEQQDMLHMVITGSPGTGKTSLGVILSKLYYSMGLLDKKESINPLTGKKEEFIFKIYKRTDLIGQYLGHTAVKTQKAIDECLGGVMFLDEAYSLGHDEKSDIYTKECLDTINQNLSENKKNFILIIAGYPEQLDKCFFSHNEGLKRRFAFRYHIDKYNSKELCDMLRLKIKLNNWNIDINITDENIIKLIDGSKDMFENFGGDIESWMLHIKIEHGVRIFGKHPKFRKIINYNDLKNGLDNFKKAKENNYIKDKLEKDKHIINNLYS